MAADSLKNVSDLVHEHMGQHRYSQGNDLARNPVVEHCNVDASVWQGIPQRAGQQVRGGARRQFDDDQSFRRDAGRLTPAPVKSDADRGKHLSRQV